jgi:tetratricopeptide (TPR) repeat protein
LLARALADCNEHQIAAQVLLVTRDRNPGDYWLLIELAHALWELPPEAKPGRDEAIACYRAALAARPLNAKTYARLGYCFDQQDKWELAELYYRRATELDPKLAEAWDDLGLIQFRRNDLMGAEKSYNTAIDSDPDYARAYTNLGFLLLQKKQFARAEEVLQNGIARDASYHFAYLNLGKAREERGNILGAIAAYQQAVDYGQHDPLAHSNRGESRRWLADWTGAEESFRTALKIKPGHALAFKNLGWLLFLRGDLTEAETCFQEVLKSDQKDAESLGKLGWILERKGNLDAAQKHYIKAAELEPDGDNAHSFQAKRLSSRPTNRDMLKQILEDTFTEHPKWSPRQRRTVHSAAAISAVWYCRPDAPGIAPSERPKFRQFAHDLFVGLLDELSNSLATSPETTAEEMISSTSDWLGDVELARVRNPFSLISLPTADAEKWIAVWARVHAIREKCLKPQRQ